MNTTIKVLNGEAPELLHDKKRDCASSSSGGITAEGIMEIIEPFGSQIYCATRDNQLRWKRENEVKMVAYDSYGVAQYELIKVTRVLWALFDSHNGWLGDVLITSGLFRVIWEQP